MRRRPAVFAAALLLFASAAFAASVPEPQSYRTENYGAPVPATLKGARVVSTEAAAELWRSGAVFIDVLPKPPKPELPEGTIWRDPPRHDIPGSIWLPDVGYGSLSPAVEAWFSANLDTAAAGDQARALVIYCKAECWMSWNAARRAVRWGYSGVVWYPGGTDDWEAAGLPLEERKPIPRPGEIN